MSIATGRLDRAMNKLIVAALIALSLSTAYGRDIAGVTLDDKSTVGDHELALNGAGLRSHVFGLFKIYVLGLYLPKSAADATAVLDSQGPKRMAIVFTRTRGAQQFLSEIQETMPRNYTAAEMATLKDRVQQLADVVLPLGELAKGTRLEFDWVPERGTLVMVDSHIVGRAIPGEDFFRALLRVWVGTVPVQEDLKQRLLGR